MLFLVWHSRIKKTNVLLMKPMTLLCLCSKTSFFCSFISSARLAAYIYFPYLTSSPAVYSPSHFQLLSPSSCHRGKQNTVAMETVPRKRARQLMRLSVWRQKPIYGHFPSAGRAVRVQPSVNTVSLSSVKNCETDGVTDRVRQGETEGGQEEIGGRM